jgi:CheY-like chemotaxis protein
MAEGSKGLRILVVDDTPVIGDVFSQIFDMLGHRPVVVDSGARALEILRGDTDATFDVIFSDISMPDMDGLTLAREIATMRQSGRLKVKLLVAMSGYSDPEDTKASLEAGFDRHIVKPPELEALEKLLEEIA